jgi:hypothetical protein
VVPEEFDVPMAVFRSRSANPKSTNTALDVILQPQVVDLGSKLKAVFPTWVLGGVLALQTTPHNWFIH